MDGFVWIILGGIGLVVVASVAIVSWMAKKRQEAWQRVAEELGLPFVDKNNDILAKCAGMKTFSTGSGRSFYNALVGDAGDTKITIGDYRFTTGSGKNRTTHVHTRCVLQSSGMQVTHCYLRPENAFFDKLGAMMGGQDINFADDPEFSRGYVLQGDDEAAVRELFDESVRGWFAQRHGQRFYFEAAGDTLVFHYARKRKPEEAGELMQQGLEIMKLLAKA